MLILKVIGALERKESGLRDSRCPYVIVSCTLGLVPRLLFQRARKMRSWNEIDVRDVISVLLGPATTPLFAVLRPSTLPTEKVS